VFIHPVPSQNAHAEVVHELIAESGHAD
jgi:hypothetical protein